ncbi:tRNA 2-thiouridine(34) synthase MnmA [Acetobacteraceae bacterium H6797]|nr:tRNA 2-thiouridine(34) synthase MnmA [Acetobacteraceae bacterium H6797]
MRILVAMSGGVDSSVVAGLLHEQGHEVIGATLQLYDHGAAVGRKGACCAGQDIMDARDVADRLGFAHYVLDRETRFKDAVIQDFSDAYAAGETPIPCVRCNQTVKFNDLVELAKDLGCEAMATGHYAQRIEGPNGAELHRAADPARDQSYFLFATTREQLEFSRFPLGGFASKAEVRAEALRLGLRVAEKPDSQDICFVPQGSYHEVVARLRPEAAEPGEIVHLDGRVLGRHQGIARYTVGQGQGLGNASRDGETRLYVAALEPTTRRVIVGPRESLPRTEVRVSAVNWLIDPPAEAFPCQVKLRAREEPRPALARWDSAAQLLLVSPEEPAIAAPGQGCVLYDGERVLAGGFIRRNAAVDRIGAAA